MSYLSDELKFEFVAYAFYSFDIAFTKFFPEFKDKFETVSEAPKQSENGITFTFQIWRAKSGK